VSPSDSKTPTSAEPDQRVHDEPISANTISVSLARGDGRTAFYLRAGFAY
jgi:hypothetical protein